MTSKKSKGNSLAAPKNRRSVWAIVLAAASALVGVVLMMAPLSTTSTQFKWHPDDVADSGVLSLDRVWPMELQIDAVFACEETTRTIFSTNGLSIRCLDGDMWASTGDTQFGPVSGHKGDAIHFTFKGESGTAVLANRSTKQWSSRTLPFENFPAIRELRANDPTLDHIAVSMTTRPSELKPDLSRWGLGALAVAFAVGSMVQLRKKSVREARMATQLLEFWPQHFSVLGALGIGALAIPMFYDDGWVIQRVSQFLETGYLGDFYFHANGWLPQGYLTESILSLFISNGASYLGLRLVVVLILWATWLIIVATARRVYESISHVTMWIAASIYVAIAVVFGTSLRAESWVGLFTATSLYFIVRYDKSEWAPHLFGAGAFAGLAFATHQSGFVAVVALLTAISQVLNRHGWKLSREIVTVGIAVVATTITVFFVGYDLTTVIGGARDFSDAAYSNRLDEFFRVGQFAGDATSGARRFAVLLPLALVGLGIAALRQTSGHTRRILVVAMLAPAGLILTSSKWGWHVAVLSVPATLLALLLIRADRSAEKWSRPQFSVIFPALTAMAGISLAHAGSWGALDHSLITWTRFATRVAGPDTQWLWIGAIVLTGLFGAALDRNSPSSPRSVTIGAMLTVVIVLAPTAASTAWIAADTYLVNDPRAVGWTALGHNIKELSHANGDSCGSLGSEPQFTTDVVSLSRSVSPVGANSLLTEIAAAGFAFNVNDAWSTVPGDRASRSTATYAVPSSADETKHMALWFNTGKNREQFDGDIKVVAHTESGHVVVRNVDIGTRAKPARWSKIEFSLPRGARDVKLVVRSTASERVVVTQPVLDKQIPARALLTGNEAFVLPSIVPSVPCVTLPSAAQGKFPATPFVILLGSNADYFFMHFPPAGVAITELRAVRREAPTVGKVSYDKATSLSTRKVDSLAGH